MPKPNSRTNSTFSKFLECDTCHMGIGKEIYNKSGTLVKGKFCSTLCYVIALYDQVFDMKFYDPDADPNYVETS